ncbi:hypothetical protein [Paenirhodobacter ferrireducens]|uniref:hypothetical protein n=1 Tax=Paenirhodobacter ferrireducens TaxID=1215032 RepID=UPI0019D1C0CE|nr:hypothetical protein [Sinirhodobacter ferrireducens]
MRTAAGEIPCDAAVIASGVCSKPLARTAGDRIPMESERGYYVEIADPAVDLAVPVIRKTARWRM